MSDLHRLRFIYRHTQACVDKSDEILVLIETLEKFVNNVFETSEKTR